MNEFTHAEAKAARKAVWVKRRALAALIPESVAEAPKSRKLDDFVPKGMVSVMSEWKTLEKVLNGCSLSRYGDGEVKHMDGKRNVSQVHDPNLTASLIKVFGSRRANHLVAIPNVYNGRSFDGISDKYIQSMRRRFYKWSSRFPKYEYGSAYVSRGDACGYLMWSSYWAVISELWRGRDVVLVCGNQQRANPINMMAQARTLSYVMTRPCGAWKDYSNILDRCLAMPKESVYLLCAGPTATVLAYDLAERGRWAVDIGHLGLFYRRMGVEYDPNPQIWHHRPTDPGYQPGNEY